MSDLSELFERDPLNLTTEDIATIVARIREAQAQFELGVAKPPAKPKKAAVDLKSLGLE